ncbi:MAG: hypothetical protein JJE09_16315, partial [Bacteroidia bacterium]|nr:hypothetical protein [Bacteroidia bacterium]
MKKILYLSLFALLSSCLSEKNADPGKPDTFVRYFNGGNNDVALVAEETGDKGIVILGTSEFSTDGGLTSKYKIKLIKTDGYGNVIWSTVYPPFSNTTKSIKANSLLQLGSPAGSEGFLVIGESINNGKSKMYILEVGTNGDTLTTKKTIDFPTLDPTLSISIQGKAIQVNNNGNYLVLGAIPNETNDMLIAELDSTTLNPIWAKGYGAGISSSLSS